MRPVQSGIAPTHYTRDDTNTETQAAPADDRSTHQSVHRIDQPAVPSMAPPTAAAATTSGLLQAPLLSLDGAAPLHLPYEDGFVCLTPTSLRLKRYYFPTFWKGKTIALADIHEVWGGLRLCAAAAAAATYAGRARVAARSIDR